MALAVALLMTACTSGIDSVPSVSSASSVPITFTMQGDFTLTTRALTADGRDMTDVWVFDYDDEGTLIQQVHQTSEDEDFGTPTITLTLGDHRLYFVATRSTGVTINTTAKTMTFTKVYDTFWKALNLVVESGGSANRSVALDRVVTKLRLTFTDPVPDGCASINITPATWYYGWNYVTGVPVAAASSQTVTVNIPASEIGSTTTSVSIFSFSTAAEWQTDVTLNSKTSADVIIGQATIPNVPLKANRVTEYSGPIFGTSGTATLSLNTEWDTPYEGTW